MEHDNQSNLFHMEWTQHINNNAIFYVAGDTPEEIQPKLENIVNNITKDYAIWNLRVNPDKCVSILWRQPSRKISQKKERKQAEEFIITTRNK